MRSKTSFFNKTAFWHDCKRFWPLTAGYTLLWLLLLPLAQFTQLPHDPYRNWVNIQYNVLSIAVEGGYVLAFCSGILFAMAVFSYLTNPRATNGLHALPARRETLYGTHYLAGLCSQLAAQAVTVALTMAVLAPYGAADARLAGLMLAGMCLPVLFFYSFGVLCMVFTGQILAAPVFYGILNILAVGMEYLVTAFAGNFLYGWGSSFGGRLGYLSPMYLLLTGEGPEADYLNHTTPRADGSMFYDPYAVTIRNWQPLVIYALAGLVLAALALLVYKKRHSEASGTTVAIYWARPIFKYGVTFCAALALGQLTYELFFGQYLLNGEYSLSGTIACMAAAGLIGYFAAEMLLKKSFRVLRSGWKGAVVVTAALVALGCVMSLDLAGYERWVPDVSEVTDVYVEAHIYGNGNHISAQVKDENTIRLVTAAHRALAEDKARQQSEEVREIERGDSVYDGIFTVSYGLKNGGFARRRYDMTLWLAEASDPSTPAGALTALYNDPDITLLRTLGKYGYNGDTDPRNLPDLRFTGGYVNEVHYERNADGDYDYRYEDQRDLTPAEARAIYSAILRDVAAGRVSDSPFAGDPRYEGYIELFATYAQPASYEPADRPTQPFEVEEGREGVTFGPDLRESMTDTLAVLRDMGIEIEFWDD